MKLEDLIIQLTDNVAVGLVLFENESTVIFTNTFLNSRTGFSREELKGTGFFENLFLDPGTKEIIRDRISSCFTKPFDNFRTQLQKKELGMIPVSISGAPFTVGDQVYAAIVIQDVTSQKAYEQVLEAGYDNFQQLTIDLETAMKKNREQQTILEAYKEKMSRELEIAMSVQKALVQKNFPRYKCLDMWGISIPSDKLGGDYFDFFQLDEKKIGFLIADVAGHGVPASLLTTMLKAYFEYYTKRYSQPDRLFFAINNTMVNFLQGTGVYFTALYYVLDLSTLKITSCIAGHDAALLFQPNEAEPIKLGEHAQGMVLGLVANAKYKAVTHQLVPGSRLVLFTDGITEARNDQGAFFGIERLNEFMLAEKNTRAEDCITRLVAEIDAFYGTSQPNDDRTVIVVNVIGTLDYYMDQDEKLKLVYTYIKIKEYKKAIEELESIIAMNNQSLAAHKLLGKVYALSGKLKEAEFHFIRSIELDDRSHDIYYNLAVVKYHLKQYKEAAGCFIKVKSLFGNYKKTETFLASIEKQLAKEE